MALEETTETTKGGNSKQKIRGEEAPQKDADGWSLAHPYRDGAVVIVVGTVGGFATGFAVKLGMGLAGKIVG